MNRNGNAAKARGAQVEKLAARHLRSQGLRIVERNYRCKYGEIDIVARDPNENALVFVEVRYRKTQSFGGATASVDRSKRARLTRSAEHFLQNNAHPHHEGCCRFDVIAAGQQSDGGIHWEWIKGAFATAEDCAE